MLFSSFWERWFSPASGKMRGGSRARTSPRGRVLGFEWLEDRRVLTAINEVQAFSTSLYQSGTSLAINVPTAVAAGDTLFVEVALDKNGTVTVADTVGNTYTKDADNSNGNVNVRTVLFHSSGVAAMPAGDTITVTMSGGSTAKAAAVQEFSGLPSSGAADATSTASGSSTAPASGNTLAIAQANELLLGAIGVQANPSVSFTAGSNYTALSSAGTSGGSDETIRPEYRIVSSIGAYNATGTLGATAQWDATLYSYKADLTTQYGFSGLPASATAGTAFNITVTAEASGGTTDTGYTGTVHFTSTDGLAGLPSNYTYTTADAGVHTFSVTLNSAGSRTITATDVDDNTVTATTSGITVNAAATSKLVVSAPSTATVGTAFTTLTVTAEDAYGNTATGYTGTVHFTSSDSQAVLPSNYTFLAANAGTQTFSVTLKTTGSQTVTATDTITGSITGTSGAVSVSPASAATFTVSAPSSAAAGTAFNVTITAKDAYGNTVTGYAGTVKFTSTDGQATLPSNYTFTSSDAGSKTFSVTVKTAGSQTVTATDTVTSTITGSSGTLSVSPGSAVTFSVSPPASTTAGTSFNITVTAKDSYGNTATGYTGTIHFTSSDAQAVLPTNYAFVSGDAGSHIFSATLKTSGNQTLTATDTVTSTITGTSGVVAIAAASAVSLSVSGPSSATAGTALNITVTAKDSYGNTATAYTGTLHFTSTDGQAALPSNYAFVSGDAGSHTFSVTLKTSGNQTLTATDTVTGTIRGTSGTVAVGAASAATFSVSGPSSATAGTAFNVTVTAKDTYGNTATGYTGTVTFISSDPGAPGLPGNYTFIGGDGGSRTFSITLKTSGNQTVTATDTVTGSITGSSGSIAVAAASATALSVSGPSTATSGTAFNITVTAKDAYGNTATGYTGMVHFTSGDSQALLPSNYTFVAADAGTQTFSVTLKTAGSQAVSATDTATGSITGTSGAVNVSPAAAVSLSVSTAASAAAGAAFNVTVTAKDTYGNTVGGYTGTVHLTSSDGQAVLPSNYAFVSGDAGSHTFSVTLKTSGNQTVTATDTVTGSISGTSGMIAVAAASATTFSVSGPSSTTAGTAFNITVTAKDTYGNTATGYTGTVTFISSDSQAGLPGNYTFVGGDAGSHTFSLTLKTAGNQTATATDTVTGAVTGTSGMIAVAAASATTFSVSGPSSATAGTAFNITVTAKDAYGNTATGYTGTVHFTSGDSQALLPSNYTFVAANSGTQTFSVTLKTASSQTVNAADTVTTSITGTSGTVAVAAASATTLTVSGPSNGTAGTAFNLTVSAKDSYGNTATGYTGTVAFTSSDGQAVLPSNYSFTAGDAGVKTLSVALETSGSPTVTATDITTGSITGTSGTVSVSPAAAVSLSVSDPASTTAGTAFNVTVTAKDPYGNTATGYIGTVYFTSSDGQAVLPSNYSFVSGDAGSHTFSVTLKTSGNQTVSAADTVTGSIAGTSGAIAMAAASATTLSVSGPSTATAGTAFNITVTAKDAYGNTATGYTGTIAFTSSDGQAALPSNYSFTAGDAGVKTFSVTLKTSGNQEVSATDTVTSTITGSSGTMAVAAASVASLSVDGPSSATAGVAFNVTVTAKDTYGNTVTGYTGAIRFTSTDSQAALPSNYAFVSGDSGSRTFSVTLKTSGNQTVAAADTVAGTITGTTGSVAVAAASATAFSVTGPSTATAGTAFNLTLTAEDAYGNTATGYTGTVMFTSTDGQAGLPSNYTFVGGDGGSHTFSLTLKTAGNQTVTAADTVSGSLTGTSGSVAVAAASATTLSVNGPSTATAGTAFNITVTAKDAYGNTATGYTGTVAFTSTDGQAVLPSDYSFMAGDAGVKMVSVTLKTSGTQSVAATDTTNGSITGNSGAVSVSPTAAVSLAVSAAASMTAGTPFNVVVIAKDTYGNTATGYTGTIHFTSSDGQAVLPSNYSFVSGDAGSHTFSITLKTSGSQTVTAIDAVTGSITGSSGALAVAAASATTLSVSSPSSVNAGTAFNIMVTAKDTYGNTAIGYAGTVAFTSTDGQAVLPSNYTFNSADAGAATFSVALKTSGSQAITATDTVTGSITGTSGTVSVAAGSTTTLSVIAPFSPTAGTAINLTITAKDAYGNTATGYLGTVHFTSSDSQAALPTDYTFVSEDAGSRVFSVTLKTSGSQTVTATDTITGSINGDSGTVSVSPASAATLSVDAVSGATAGTSLNVTVTAKDAYGNIASGYSGTVHFTSTDGQAALPSNYSFVSGDAGSHVFSVALKTSGSQTVTATDTVTSTIAGTSGTVVVAAASAASLLVHGPSSTTAGTAFTVTVTAQDAFGNTATDYTGTVGFTSTDGQAVLPNRYAFISANAGVATFSVTLKTSGDQTITATDTVANSIAGSSAAIVTSPAGASHLAVSAPASATAGVVFDVTIAAIDPYGNTATSFTGTVAFTSSDAAAVLPASYSFVAGDGGTHTFTVTLKTSGNQTLSAADTTTPSIAGTSGSIATAAAIATHFSLSAPTSAAAGTPFNITATALDQFGNTATGYGGTVHFTSSDGAALLAADSTLASGVGTFGITLKTSGNRTITAADTVSGSIAGTSNLIAVSAAAATHFSVASPGNATAGTAFNITVSALDPYGNVAVGYLGTVQLTSTDAAAVLPADFSFSSSNAGVATLSVTLKTSGNQSITATDTVNGSISGTSGAIANVAGAATHLSLAAPATATAGTSFNLTVTALDAYGNAATAYTGIVQFSSTDGVASLPANSTLIAGTGMFAITLKTVGNQTITATDTVSGSITGTSPAIATSAGPVTHFAFSTPASATAGVAFNVTVTAEDACGNVVTNYAQTVGFTSTDAAADLPANSTLTNGAGTFVVNLKTAGNQTVTASDTVTGSISASSGFIVIQAAAATHLSVTATASTYAGAAFNVTVAALDPYGNTDTHYVGAIRFTSTDGQAMLPGDYAFAAADGGTHSFSVVLKTAGNQTVTATDTTTGSINGTTGNISNAPANATHMVFSAPANATAGTAFSVTVTVKDQFNNTATSYSGMLHFYSSDTAAVLPADSTLTNGVGTFSVTLKTAGSQTITVEDTNDHSIDGTTSFIATAAAPATQFVLAAPTTATAGSSFSMTLAAEDPYGNIATTYAGTVYFTSSDPAAVLPANYAFVAGDVGIHTFSVTLKTAGNQTLTATDTAANSITGSSGTIATTAAAATHLAVGAPANARAGTAFNITITALDAYGNTATGYLGTVHFTSSDGQAVLPANYTFTSGDAGGKTFSVTLKTSGNQTLTVTDTVTGSIDGTSGVVSNSPAAATQFTLSTAASATAGAAFNITVAALDAYGNTDTSYSGTVHFTSSDAAALLPADQTLTAGLATLSVTLKTVGNQTVTATDTVTRSIIGTSGTIAIAAGAATQYMISAPTTATAGVEFNVTVTALDAYGNIASGYTGTMHLASSDAAAVLPADNTLTGGVGTFSVTLKTAGNQTFTASDTGDPSITGTSGSIANAAAEATQLTVRAPASVTVGSAFNVTVTALDAYGNTAAGYTGTVHFSSNDGAAVLPGNSTLTSGVGTFSVTLKTSGIRIITTADAVNDSVSGASGTISAAASAATHFAIGGPASASAGVAFDVTVRALDAFNNTATGYLGTIQFASSDPGAPGLPGDYAFTGADAGTATFSVTLRTAGSQTVTATDIASGSVTGASGTINITAASASHFTVTAPASVIVGSAFDVTVTALDPFGNIAGEYAGLIQFASSDGAALLPANSTLTSGIGTFLVVLPTPGNQSVTVSDTLNSSLSGTTGSIAALAIQAHFVVSMPAIVRSGSTFDVTVRAVDDSGNFLSIYSGIIEFTSSDAAALLPGKTFVAGGTGSFSAEFNTLANETFTVNDTNDPAVNGTSTSLVVARSAVITGNSPTGYEGTAMLNTVVASFTYGDERVPAADLSAVIDWGDLTTSVGTIVAAGNEYQVTGSHTYAWLGGYPLTVTTSYAGVVIGQVTGLANVYAPLLPDETRGTATQRLISALYYDLLDRAVEQEGLAYWANAFNAGLSVAEFTQAIESSHEYREKRVNKLFQQYLHRDADPGGLNWGIELLSCGDTIEELSAAIIASREYVEGVCESSDETFLDNVFINVLGRPIDVGSLNYFLALMDAGMPPSQIATLVLAGDEYWGDMIQADFQQYLGRAAEPRAVTALLQAVSSGLTDQQLLVLIAGQGSGSEYYNRATA